MQDDPESGKGPGQAEKAKAKHLDEYKPENLSKEELEETETEQTGRT